jgi:type IV secretion system protein VirB8
MKKITQWLRNQMNGVQKTRQSKDYFSQANDWSDDYYLTILSSRNRYRCAFLLVSVLSVCLVISVTSLVPSQHVEPFLVHHYESGAVSVEPVKAGSLPLSEAETESEIIRYVINRESYSHYGYKAQYSLVNLLSNSLVSRQYQKEQDSDDKQSFIALYGTTKTRDIHVENVLFLDVESEGESYLHHQNLAEVNFTATITNFASGKEEKQTLVATLSWEYAGMPKDPETRWKNWSGFKILSYHISQRSL